MHKLIVYGIQYGSGTTATKKLEKMSTDNNKRMNGWRKKGDTGQENGEEYCEKQSIQDMDWGIKRTKTKQKWQIGTTNK